MQSGFDGASMNEIARVAGVSKGTLYVYFASKEELFEGLIIDEKREQAEQLCRFEEDASDIRLALAHFGFTIGGYLTDLFSWHWLFSSTSSRASWWRSSPSR